jgi:hypothetical protein
MQIRSRGSEGCLRRLRLRLGASEESKGGVSCRRGLARRLRRCWLHGGRCLCCWLRGGRCRCWLRGRRCRCWLRGCRCLRALCSGNALRAVCSGNVLRALCSENARPDLVSHCGAPDDLLVPGLHICARMTPLAVMETVALHCIHHADARACSRLL